MDPVSHVAFGRTLVALDTRRTLGAGAIAACVLGSLAPDIDAVFMPIGWDIYLRVHQGGTHSLLGSLACAGATAAAVRSASRRSLYLPLLLAAWVGAAGHLLLDVISGADVRLFWPVGSPVALPLFAMADPWLGGVLVLGLVTLVSRTRQSGRLAASILLVAAVLAGAKAALYARIGPAGEQSDSIVRFRRAEAEWGSLTRWITYEARADVVEARRVNALTGTVTPLIQLSRGLNDPLVVRSRGLETVQNLLLTHGVTFAVIDGSADSRQVLWSDLRYCVPLGTHAAHWPPIVPMAGSPVSCALWFGGEFDAAALPRAVVVHVGHFVQRRPVR